MINAQPDFVDADYPADPYPGIRPPASFILRDETGYVITPDEGAPSGWTLRGADLDEILAAQGETPLSGRLPVLAYGSNANPSKISWLRKTLGLTGIAIVTRAQCHGIAAVWSAGVRARDNQRPAVLAAYPGAEDHAVWLATSQQRKVLDQCEGRGQRYRLAWVHTQITLEGNGKLDQVLAYTARPEALGHHVPIYLNRSPLLVNGTLIRCADVGQAEARQLTGVPAASDGLDCTEVSGEP